MKTFISKLTDGVTFLGYVIRMYDKKANEKNSSPEKMQMVHTPKRL